MTPPAVIDVPGSGYYRVEKGYVELLREVGLPDGMSVFEHPKIQPWRTLPDRENCTLDHVRADGSVIRLHIKRTKRSEMIEAEVAGILRLKAAGIPTVPLVAHGKHHDGRGFLVTEDLAGFDDSEKLLERGAMKFDEILQPTADLAAKLHTSNLHHQDMYLCHFFTRRGEQSRAIEVRLIDAQRVGKLWKLSPLRRKWIVKDLAQFWFSTLALSVSDKQREMWLNRYADKAKVRSIESLKASVLRKVDSIARHDKKLRESQPTRNVSIPR